MERALSNSQMEKGNKRDVRMRVSEGFQILKISGRRCAIMEREKLITTKQDLLFEVSENNKNYNSTKLQYENNIE
jgi:hypothetical protein